MLDSFATQVDESARPPPSELSDTSLIVALFDWQALLLASSVSRSLTDRESMLTPMPCTSALSLIVVLLRWDYRRQQRMSLVYCPLCQRHVGSWSFATVVTLAEDGMTSEEQEQQYIPSPSTNGKSVSAFISACEAITHFSAFCGLFRTSAESLLSWVC
ncbi:hypothetical protein F5J12DRAFT_864637 [Pisolithus orientalis]|uniref:uncharacterized protein n=1 Tax=Pisolithus orientalis TaxID=936130 RepID=UPI002223F11C|nr:uncharacterized protein F5J12DRAFT_864637 [Pisolithus orientalis]KAI5989211.1 hypothetical protein F5J12DRAFT_864637 [Pisolithus orientalis]